MTTAKVADASVYDQQMLGDRFHRLLGKNAETVNQIHLDTWAVEQEPQLN